jgi:hypothetical protein
LYSIICLKILSREDKGNSFLYKVISKFIYPKKINSLIHWVDVLFQMLSLSNENILNELLYPMFVELLKVFINILYSSEEMRISLSKSEIFSIQIHEILKTINQENVNFLEIHYLISRILFSLSKNVDFINPELLIEILNNIFKGSDFHDSLLVSTVSLYLHSVMNVLQEKKES